MWDYGRVYVKEGTEERRFFCQITKACREGDGVVGPTCIAFTGTTDSNAMNHLAIHGISSKKTIAVVANEAAAAAAKKRRNDDLAGATKAGNRDRWLKLSFVKTWTIGQFSPFVLGEKRDIRNFMTDIGACRSGVGEEHTIDDSTDAPPPPPPPLNIPPHPHRLRLPRPVPPSQRREGAGGGHVRGHQGEGQGRGCRRRGGGRALHHAHDRHLGGQEEQPQVPRCVLHGEKGACV